jgi:hypothetical protein
MSCWAICRSLKLVKFDPESGLRTLCAEYLTPLSELCEFWFYFLPLGESSDSMVQYIIESSLEHGHGAEIDAVDFGRHHRYHLPRQLHFLLKGRPQVSGYGLIDICDYFLILLPWLFEEEDALLAVRTHEFGSGLGDVYLGVYHTAIELLVSWCFFIFL